MNHHSSAKSGEAPKKQRWVYPECVVCGKPFPYAATRWAYLIRVGKPQLCCSLKCGMEYRRQKKAQEAAA